MLKIKGIMWGERKIGIALHKLEDGNNAFEIDVVNSAGERFYPGIFVISKEAAIAKYGISTINKNNLQGIWIPLRDLEKTHGKDKKAEV